MNVVPSLPQLLRVVRALHGLTRTHMAHLLGVSARTVEGWEMGRPPPQPIVLRLALERMLTAPDDGNPTAPAKISEEDLREYLSQM